MQIRIKIFSQRAKKGFRDFALNSKNGVKTPSWRILGIKKCSPKFGVKFFIKKLNYKIILTKREQLFTILLEMMNMIYNYNKLVRDKIPEEVNNMEGRKASYKILNDNEYIQELNKKLFEEAHEFIEEHSVEELADLMEVIYAIMEIKNISSNEVEIARKQKNKNKGSFKNKVYLINVEQEQIDEHEEKELNKEWRKNILSNTNNTIFICDTRELIQQIQRINILNYEDLKKIANRTVMIDKNYTSELKQIITDKADIIKLNNLKEKYNNDEKIKKELLTEIKEIASYYGTISGN